MSFLLTTNRPPFAESVVRDTKATGSTCFPGLSQRGPILVVFFIGTTLHFSNLVVCAAISFNALPSAMVETLHPEYSLRRKVFLDIDARNIW